MAARANRAAEAESPARVAEAESPVRVAEAESPARAAAPRVMASVKVVVSDLCGLSQAA